MRPARGWQGRVSSTCLGCAKPGRSKEQESRHTLNGALRVLRPGGVEMAATDGHRLPLAARDVGVDGLKSEERLLVPKRAVMGLHRLANAQEADSPVHIAKDESHLFFSARDPILITWSISGQFPNYEAVLLFVSQRYDRIHLRSAARRDVARQQDAR
jgi:DNA polymerase III sliding clamp (beta) subunit (PCNA family)